MPELLLNERDTAKGRLVSVCDADVLGEEFERGEVSLSIDPAFYDGPTADPQAVLDSLVRCDVANLVGNRAVGLAVEQGLVREESVLEFDGTRHAQLLRM